ncbi:MAG TPA: 3-isopropylmalate dehydratase small subunit [Gemmatimonadaceae bacterium]|nr:3-isopropylmalate dehydratase small subunit [Gemmatimonadaceae bacterium]
MKALVTTFSSNYLTLRADDIDTDQIIPARFLTTTERTGLGEHLFHDWRYLPSGAPNPAFTLNAPGAKDAKILVAGRNFGCGSSREHAVWALTDAGFRAVVSESFADIFRSNAIGNGLLPIQVSRDVAQQLLLSPATELGVDLAAQTLSRGSEILATFRIAPFAKHCLMHGIDEMEFLLNAEPAIAAYEAAL